jgi:hypothetical protein
LQKFALILARAPAVAIFLNVTGVMHKNYVCLMLTWILLLPLVHFKVRLDMRIKTAKYHAKTTN